LNLDELHTHVQTGDQSAREELFAKLSGRFRLFAQRKIQNRQDAEEVVQKAILTVLEKYDKLKIEKSFSGWASQVLNNKVLDYYRDKGRRQQRYEQLPEIDQQPVPWVGDPTFEGEMLKCLKKIGEASNRLARILNLYYQGYKTPEICKSVDCSSGNLYKLLGKARTMLKLCLENGEIE